jgi:predicted nucleotidyltransferase component of viral defense system
MRVPLLKEFSLVGGTALSLVYGHRISVDLDLFSQKPFEVEELVNDLKLIFGDRFRVRSSSAGFGLFCFVGESKIDLVRSPHPTIRPIYETDGIRFISTEDIVAMKVQAVLGRARKKDFWDIATLLEHYTVDDFTQFHKEKYSTQNLFVTVPQAISYFADAEDDLDPKSLKGQTWESVKSTIQKEVRGFFG